MSRFLYENFYFIEGFAGALAIGVIVAKCIRDVRRSNKMDQEVAAAIRNSHRLRDELLSAESIDRQVKAMKQRMRLEVPADGEEKD